jgi:hypothetical protein
MQHHTNHATLELPPEASVRGLEDAARDALLLFLSQAAYWGKLELASWLARDYRDATLDGRRDEACAPSEHHVEATSVHELLTKVHHEISEVIANGDAEAIASELEHAGVLARVHDLRGDIGFAPVDGAHLPLRTRVLSLWAVDALSELHPRRTPAPPRGHHSAA